MSGLYYKIISRDRNFFYTPIFFLLRVCSFFYGCGLLARNWAYRLGALRSHRLDRRVISVGNLTLGGTGKTPLVMLIAQTLKSQGRKPAILSRGYGGVSKNPVNVVADGERVLLTADRAGDEPVMMARRLGNVPVLTGPNRYQTGRYAIDRLGADTLILDDGFQRRALARDLNILLLDHRAPLGNGKLFPAGELREPMEEAKRADLICFTRYSSSEQTGALPLPEKIPVIKTVTEADALVDLAEGRERAVDSFAGQKVAAFCGIAKPEEFKKTLGATGGELVFFRAFKDHHRYSRVELQTIDRSAEDKGAKCIIVSEKDAVKIDPSVMQLPIYFLSLRVKIIKGEEIFNRLILNNPSRKMAETPPG